MRAVRLSERYHTDFSPDVESTCLSIELFLLDASVFTNGLSTCHECSLGYLLQSTFLAVPSGVPSCLFYSARSTTATTLRPSHIVHGPNSSRRPASTTGSTSITPAAPSTSAAATSATRSVDAAPSCALLICVWSADGVELAVLCGCVGVEREERDDVEAKEVVDGVCKAGEAGAEGWSVTPLAAVP
jgi:hypothetical protein